MLIRLNSDGPSGAQLYVVNGAVATGYTVTNDIDWGNAVWQHVASGPRGTQGARPATGAPDNRVVSIPIHIGPTGSVDSCNLKAALLVEIVDELRRFGGTILWQATSQGFRQFFKVMDAGVTKQSWGRKGAIVDTADCVILADCAPYMLGDPMDTLDTFAIDSIADYTKDSGTPSLSVAGGLLVPSATGALRYRHTAKGYVYGDVQVTLKVKTGTTLTNGIWGVTARANVAGLDTLFAAEIVAGTNVIRVNQIVAGSSISTDTAAFTPVANTTYWVRLRFEGGRAIAEVFTSAPTPVSTPTASAARILSTAEGGKFYNGHAGIRITVADTTERYGPFQVEPYTYRLINAPEQIRLQGQIPGDVPAICDLTMTPQGGSAAPIWGLAAWLERPLIANLCWNGDFESAAIGTSGWSTAAVSGVLAGPSTSVTRDTTAARNKYGAANLAIVTPATTDMGASFLINQRFKAGRLYAAFCWASSAATTPSVKMKLGVSGDLATGIATTLTTTPVLFSVAWTPTADRDSAYVAFVLNSATAGTMNIDGVVVMEVPSITLSAAISSGNTTMTVNATPSDIPNLMPDGTISAPFLIVIDAEILRVTAVNLGTGVWNIDRAQEGTSIPGGTHAINAAVIIMPPLRPHLEGKGAQAPFGVIEADSYVPVLSSPGAGTFTANTADANARGGTVLRWTPGTSGAQLATLVYFVDPALLVPDDYTLGEFDVEVYLRELWATSLTGLKVTLSSQPEGGSTFGGERFTREWGSVGKLITLAGAKVARPHRLGAIPMIVDRANPQRWRLKITLSCTGGATPTWDLDHFMLAATRYRLASPTGEVNDTASASGAYPDFVPYDAAWGGSSAMSKLMRSDMSAAIAAPGGYFYPDVGLGRVLEMPDTDVDLLIKVSNLIPDDPTVDSTAETSATTTTSAHAAMTPRYQFARSS